VLTVRTVLPFNSSYLWFVEVNVTFEYGMGSPSIRDACTHAEEEVAAWGASASSVEAGTCPNDEVDAGARCSSSSLKDRRRRQEGGECEPIKIHRRNLVYISESTRCTSLLTRSRPPSIDKLSALRTGLEIITETQIDASKNTCEIDDKNRIK
jgi:hypothetical protein